MPRQSSEQLRIIANRQRAYVVDYILWHVTGLILFRLSGLAEAIRQDFKGWRFAVVVTMLLCFYRMLLICKDGWYGLSPGKLMFNLRVVDRRTRAPIGFARSAQRNLLLLLPFIGELIIPAQMRFRARWFDNWAQCDVEEVVDDDFDEST